MTDNEIIKALECCTLKESCIGCPFVDSIENKYRGGYACAETMRKSALDLINRQKAEIERYKGVIRLLEKDVKTAKDDGAKEFAKLCIDKAVKGVIYAMDIPDYVQEMVGDIK